MNIKQYSLALFITTLAACSSSIKDLQVYHQPNSDIIQASFPEEGLSIQYLGVGGHLFRFGDTALMTAPSITNPHFLAVGPFIPVSPNTEQIDRLLPDVSDVDTILVGHAHYDHLMDVPYIMQNKAKKAHVYGSRTMSSSIAPSIDISRRHALNESMAILNEPGTWHYNKTRNIRFMAIKSSHAPHFMGINLMTGTYEEDLSSLPWHAFAWKEGQTLAYLIDFLSQEEEILHRVFYQDSASQEPLGLIPQLAETDQKRVDIAIITPASFIQVDNYPESVMGSTQAKHFILGHWEDFFDNQDQKEQRFIRSVSPTDFFTRLEAALPNGSQWTMPQLFHTQYFSPNGNLINPENSSETTQY